MVLGFAIDIRISLFLCLKFFSSKIELMVNSFRLVPRERCSEHFHASLNKRIKSQFPNLSNEFNDIVIIS